MLQTRFTPQETGGRVGKTYNLLSLTGDAVYIEYDQPIRSRSGSVYDDLGPAVLGPSL